jgi:hypothetical protein
LLKVGIILLPLLVTTENSVELLVSEELADIGPTKTALFDFWHTSSWEFLSEIPRC